MKKFNSILAIAAVALTSVFGFSSCEKEDIPTPTPEPEQETKVSDRTCTLVVSQDLLDVCTFEISVLHKNHSNDTYPLTTDDFKEVSDIAKFTNLVAFHNSAVGTQHPEIKIDNSSDLKKLYREYTYTLKNVNETDQVIVSYSKSVNRNVNEEQLNSKNQFYAYGVGNIVDGMFTQLAGEAFVLEKGSGLTKDYVKDLFSTDFSKEFELR